MKKITLLILLLTSVFGFAQTPSGAAPTPPARDAGDVISLFTQTTDASTTVYNDISVADFNPNWGSTSGNVTIDPQGGDRALTYPNFDYQGIVIGSNVNLSAMTTMHVDIWTNTASPNVYLISATTGEKFVNVPAAAGQWSSVEIALSDFTNQGLSISDIKELKFATDSGPSGVAIYIDNIYFSKPAVDPMTDATLSDLQVDGNTIAGFSSSTETYNYGVLPGAAVPTVTATTTNGSASTNITQAPAIPGDATVVVTAQDGTTMKTYTVSFFEDGPTSAAPAPPTRNAWDVISIYSDEYTDVNSTFDAGWCGGSSVEEVSIGGNNTQFYKGNPCQGIDFSGNQVDATGFTHLHIDFYTTETNLTGKVFNLKLVDFGGGGSEVGNVEIPINTGTTPAIVSGQWVSVDVMVDLSTFTGLAQAAITSNLNNKVWYDNFYVYRAATASVKDNDLIESSVYPNPSSNGWNISTPNNVIKSVEVYNLIGKKVLTQKGTGNQVTVPTETLSSGIYIAKINTDIGVKTVKLIRN